MGKKKIIHLYWKKIQKRVTIMISGDGKGTFFSEKLKQKGESLK